MREKIRAPRRGFGSMKLTDPKRHRELSSLGGNKAKHHLRPHQWTREQALAWAKIGGTNSAAKRWGAKREAEQKAKEQAANPANVDVD